MPSWKKVIVSGSNVHLAEITASGEVKTPSVLSTNITASGDVKADGSVTASAYSGVGGRTTIGSTLTGLNKTSAGTSIASALDSIDGVLAKLAPAKPNLLGTTTLQLNLGQTTGTEFWGYSSTTLAQTGSSANQNVTTQTIQKLYAGSGTNGQYFFDGDTSLNDCELSASVQTASGSWTVLGNRLLTAGGGNEGDYVGDDGNSNTKLDITTDSAMSGDGAEFWRNLRAFCQTNYSANVSTTNRVRLELKVNGDSTGNVQEASFWVVNPSTTSITTGNNKWTNTAINGAVTTYSGINYLKSDSTVSASFKITADSTFNFINDEKKLSRVVLGGGLSDTAYYYAGAADSANTKAVPINADAVIPITSSLSIANNKYGDSSTSVFIYSYGATNSSNSSYVDNDAQTSVMYIDSKANTETNPGSGCTRVRSGTGQHPDYDTSGDTKFGWTYSNSALLTTSAYSNEFQYSDQKFHWPHSKNYSAAGSIPENTANYSGIGTSGDSGYGNRRFATFNLGSVTGISGFTLNLYGISGWDSSLHQTTDKFHLYGKIMNGAVEQTCWFNLNKSWSDWMGDTILCSPSSNDHTDDGSNSGDDKGVITSGNIGTSGNLYRVVNLGSTYSGTLYIRIGWDSNGTAGHGGRYFQYISLA